MVVDPCRLFPFETLTEDRPCGLERPGLGCYTAADHVRAAAGDPLTMSSFALSRVLLLVVALFGLAVLPTYGGEGTTGAGPDAEDVLRETKEAVETTKQYTVQQKEAFSKKVQHELKEMQGKISELRRKAENASAEAKVEFERAIKDLEKKKDEARKKLDEVNETTNSAFVKLRDGMVAAIEELKNSYTDAVSKLP